MVRAIGVVVAGLFVLVGNRAASAQITGVVTGRELYNLAGLTLPLGSTSPQPVITQNVSIVDGSVQNNFATRLPSPGATGPGGVPVYSITNYQVSTSIDNALGYVSFASNATVAGQYAQTSVGTVVDVSYRNGGSTPLNVTLNSTIIPAGFGAYVSNPSGNVMGGDINHHPETTSSSFVGIQGPATSGNTIQTANAQVFFQILSGTTTVASYTAQLQIALTPSGQGYRTATPVLTASGSVFDGSGVMQPLALANFGLIDADDAGRAVGYRWDATDIAVPLGAIAPGESRTLTYVTRVETDVLGTGLGSSVAQLLAYAGFGDPIGEHAGAGGISDPDFRLLNLTTPTFVSDGTNATLTFGKFAGYAAGPLPLQQFDGAGFAATVPEPAGWATMTAGVGLAGAAARRRRRPAHRRLRRQPGRAALG